MKIKTYKSIFLYLGLIPFLLGCSMLSNSQPTRDEMQQLSEKVLEAQTKLLKSDRLDESEKSKFQEKIDTSKKLLKSQSKEEVVKGISDIKNLIEEIEFTND